MNTSVGRNLEVRPDQNLLTFVLLYNNSNFNVTNALWSIKHFKYILFKSRPPKSR